MEHIPTRSLSDLATSEAELLDQNMLMQEEIAELRYKLNELTNKTDSPKPYSDTLYANEEQLDVLHDLDVECEEFGCMVIASESAVTDILEEVDEEQLNYLIEKHGRQLPIERLDIKQGSTFEEVYEKFLKETNPVTRASYRQILINRLDRSTKTGVLQ